METLVGWRDEGCRGNTGKKRHEKGYSIRQAERKVQDIGRTERRRLHKEYWQETARKGLQCTAG